MKRAGIKVWVLTGDKVGTAKMIGLSTGLLEPKPNMEIHEITEDVTTHMNPPVTLEAKLDEILAAAGKVD